MRRSEEKYRLITENSSDMILTIDKEGNLLYMSPSHTALLGYDLLEMESSSLFQWIHEEDRERVIDSIQDMITKERGSSQLEFRILTNKTSRHGSICCKRTRKERVFVLPYRHGRTVIGTDSIRK